MPSREVPRRTLVIDAYNVLHRLRDRRPRRGEEARAWLESLIRRWRAARRSAPRIVLVYDGSAGETSSRQERVRGFEVRYAGSSSTADDLILSIARAARSEDAMTVVTSDRYDIVRHLGGFPVRHQSAESFAGELTKLADRARAGGEKPERVSGEDVTSWVEEFGFRREGKRR